jgi:hypothetical protein
MDLIGCLLDDDFPGHLRVDGTKIRVGSRGREGVGKVLAMPSTRLTV